MDKYDEFDEILAAMPKEAKEAAARHNEQDRVISKLMVVWREHPELRLCQLIENALGGHDCIYYVSDDELLKRLEAYDEQR